MFTTADRLALFILFLFLKRSIHNLVVPVLANTMEQPVSTEAVAVQEWYRVDTSRLLHYMWTRVKQRQTRAGVASSCGNWAHRLGPWRPGGVGPIFLSRVSSCSLAGDTRKRPPMVYLQLSICTSSKLYPRGKLGMKLKG